MPIITVPQREMAGDGATNLDLETVSNKTIIVSNMTISFY